MKELKFNNGKLKIVQFTDLHYEDGRAEDMATLALMRGVLEAENPDFIAITGDSVYGEYNAESLPKVLAPILETDKPWALVFGNHDTEWGKDKRTLFNVANELSNCYMQNLDDSISGVGNYYIPVKSDDNITKWVLYFMDSMQYNCNKIVEGYDYFKRDQINWYYNSATQLLKNEGEHGALAFFHIALPEYNEVWDKHVCYGEKHEAVCCPEQNSGMFSAMLEVGNMRGTFVGHDHVDDYWGELYGVKLCFGRASGYNTYGHDGFERGARIIEITEGDTSTFKSCIRLVTGEVITEQQKHLPQK